MTPSSISTVKIATEPKLQLCGGWGGQQGGYALEGCVDASLLRPPPPQPHSSQLGTVYATKRRRRNGKRFVHIDFLFFDEGIKVHSYHNLFKLLY